MVFDDRKVRLDLKLVRPQENGLKIEITGTETYFSTNDTTANI